MVATGTPRARAQVAAAKALTTLNRPPSWMAIRDPAQVNGGPIRRQIEIEASSGAKVSTGIRTAQAGPGAGSPMGPTG